MTSGDDRRVGETLLRMLLDQIDALEALGAAADPKAVSGIEGRLRAIGSGARAAMALTSLMAAEDNMDKVNGAGPGQGGVSRSQELRAELERRLDRIRAALEAKQAARPADGRSDRAAAGGPEKVGRKRPKAS
jgi:hypothetical protein